MKNTQKCSKCGSSHITMVKGQVQAYGSGNNIKVGMTLTSAVPVDRFICLECGFVEEWVCRKEYLDEIAEHYGHAGNRKQYPWIKKA